MKLDYKILKYDLRKYVKIQNEMEKSEKISVVSIQIRESANSF